MEIISYLIPIGILACGIVAVIYLKRAFCFIFAKQFFLGLDSPLIAIFQIRNFSRSKNVQQAGHLLGAFGNIVAVLSLPALTNCYSTLADSRWDVG